jgi:hypothetical protein
MKNNSRFTRGGGTDFIFQNAISWCLIDYVVFYVPLKTFPLNGDVTTAGNGCKI